MLFFFTVRVEYLYSTDKLVKLAHLLAKIGNVKGLFGYSFKLYRCKNFDKYLRGDDVNLSNFCYESNDLS